jgi:hypothetical protein
VSSAGSARSFYCHGGTARGPRLAAGAVGELGSARSPGAVGRKEHGFRSGFGRRGSCSWFRANFLHRLGERAEFFRHRERFLVTSLQFKTINYNNVPFKEIFCAICFWRITASLTSPDEPPLCICDDIALNLSSKLAFKNRL